MHEGQTARVTAVTATTITVECGGTHAYTLGPASAAHARHAELKIGDVLVAVNDSTATGDTLVRMTPLRMHPPASCRVTVAGVRGPRR